jgi:NTP pyrophosphatase (non-canonical NTP hydrolase)
MEFAEYSEKAACTDSPKPLWYYALGLVGEAGEVSEKIKKLFRDHGGNLNGEYADSISLELGDVLWYVDRMAALMGYALEDVARMNNEKTLSRLARGVISGEGDNR